jgi:hypothetical protein
MCFRKPKPPPTPSMPRFHALLNSDDLSHLAAEHFIAEYADHLPTPPALRLLPSPPTRKPTPLIERPSARVVYAGKVIFATFG